MIKKISEEEDKKLYELYKKSHAAHTAFSFEEFRKNPLMFPPATAPGIVRRAWREKIENATEQERSILGDFAWDACEMLNTRKGAMPNDLDGYLSLMEDMKVYLERYKNCPGVDPGLYGNLMDIANSFENEIKKYK